MDLVALKVRGSRDVAYYKIDVGNLVDVGVFFYLLTERVDICLVPSI